MALEQTAQIVADPPVEEPVVPPVEEPTTPVEEPEVDYKAKYEEAQGTITTLTTEKERAEQQNNTNKGILNQRFDQQAEVRGMRRQMQQSNEYMKTIVDSLATGDTAKLTQTVAAIDERYSQEDTQNVATQEANDLFADLKAEAEDAGLDLFQAPELAGVRAMWDAGYNNPKGRNTQQMKSAVREAQIIRRDRQKGLTQAEVQKTEDAANQRLRESGVVSTPVGQPSGTRGPASDEGIYEAYGRGEVPWSARVREAGKKLGYNE